MKKTKVIIITIITFFVLVRPASVFSAAASIKTVEWRNDFSQRRIIDNSRSTIDWERGSILLPQEGDAYISSGILWTDEIRFFQDIYSLTLEGDYYEPEGTRIIPYVTFKKDNKEYVLNWNDAHFPKEAVRRLYLKVFLGTNNPDVSPILHNIQLTLELQDRSEKGIAIRDRTRVNDLRAVRDNLEKYYTDFGQYPVIPIDIDDKEDQWRLLHNILESASTHYRKTYTRRFPSQKDKVDDPYKYGYMTNASGSYFLLWVNLENINSEHFQESYKDEVLDIGCSAPIYCISSKKNIIDSLIRYFEDKVTADTDQILGTNFIKENNDPRVYLSIGGSRVWLRTPQIFKRAGGIWENIKTFVSRIETPLVKFVKTKESPSVYLVTKTGFKRSMLNEQVLASYGALSEIITVGKDIINALPDNYLIRAYGDTRVYFLSEKIKRWITTPYVLEKLGFSFEEVVEIDPMELNLYPEGNPIF
ncbi:hypothetical protein MYX06_02550 [Patescibacteria group bacterium AH-259-L05]|nr:hypothetical protein [Patescibacteria group bacterium AH-259-L05]